MAIVAIQPDDYTVPGAAPGSDAASPRWARCLEQRGHRVRWVDVRRADILEQVQGCDGFRWRWAHFGGMAPIARRLLPVLEYQLGMAVYPEQRATWHYDDKPAQALAFQAAGLPAPHSWTWHDEALALSWLGTAEYPLVMKLKGGASSTNVQLLRDAEEARALTRRAFRRGLRRLRHGRAVTGFEGGCHAALEVLDHALHANSNRRCAPEAGYVHFQEFLPGNSFDTRVTAFAGRVFAFRRFNRPGDFRASGSGRIDWDPSAIDLRFIGLAHHAAARLNMESCALDGLYRGDQPVIVEVSFTFDPSAVRRCPGHWRQAALGWEWVDGQMDPEDLQIEAFCKRLECR